MPSEAHQDNLRRLLEELEAGRALSQRVLAARLGIALGRTNQLLQALVSRGWIEIEHGAGQRRHYVVTAAGADAHARMTREFLGRAVASFVPARDRIRNCLTALSVPAHDGGHGSACRPAVVMHAPDGIAHVAFACAVETGVDLVGFVDDGPHHSLLGLPVRSWSDLTPLAFDGHRFDWLLIASLSNQDGIRERLHGIGFPLDRVSWL